MAAAPQSAHCFTSLLSAPAAAADCLYLLPNVSRRHYERIGEVRWGAYDLALELPGRAQATVEGARAGSMITNPSVICHNGRLLLAIREMHQPTVQPPCTDVWRSKVIVSQISAYSSERRALVADSRCITDLTPAASFDGEDEARGCVRAGRVHSVGFGAEDPRWTLLAGAVHLGVNVGGVAARHGDLSRVRTTAGSRIDEARRCEDLGERRDMLLLLLEPPRGRVGATASEVSVGVPLYSEPTRLRWADAPSPVDRNWLFFEHRERNADGVGSGKDALKAYALFSIEPHLVLRLGEGGACVEEHRTSNPVFGKRFAGRVVHGGANPLLISSAQGKPFYYVSVFHTKDDELRYKNYVYTFAARPPFEVISVGRKALRLKGKRVRFVTSLTSLGRFEGEDVLMGISYGVDDRSARFSLRSLSSLLSDQQVVSSRMQGGERAGSVGGVLTMPDFQLQLRREALASAARQSQTERASRSFLVVDTSHTAGDGRCTIMEGWRYDAPSIHITTAATAAECCDTCSSYRHQGQPREHVCHAFSWLRASRACMLKQWSGTAHRVPGAVSGHSSRAATCGCELRAGVRVNGTLLRAAFALGGAAECCSRCMHEHRCNSFSLVPANAVMGSALGRPYAVASAVGLGGGSCQLWAEGREAFVPMASYAIGVGGASGAVAGTVALKRKVLLVHNQLPHARMGSDLRLLAMVEQLARAGFDPLFAAPTDFDPGPVLGRGKLMALGADILAPITSATELVSFARAKQVSTIIFTLWFWGGQQSMPERYLRQVRLKLPHVRLVVMTDDVHHLREGLLAAEHIGYGDTTLETIAKMKKQEEWSYYYADHVLTISNGDRSAIRAAMPKTRRMHAQRFSMLRHVFSETPHFPLADAPSFDARCGLLFVGNLNNPTNAYGLVWFLRSVLPLLRAEDPSIRLRVVGSAEGQVVKASGLDRLLQEASGVDQLGFVEQLADELRAARVFVVPVRVATGVLTKQSLAHVHGLPTVVTKTAAQHIAPEPLDDEGNAEIWNHWLGNYKRSRVAMVADKPGAFAAAVMHLYRNRSAWQELTHNSARFARSGGGKGLCPSGLRLDLLAFMSKLHNSVCISN